jgi:hypothetical protein
MKNLQKIITLFSVIFILSSCKNSQSLQQYYVENQQNNDFIAVDVAASLLNIDESGLSEEAREAYKSVNKMNILAYQMKGENDPTYNIEKKKVLEILKADKYKELMKFKSNDIKVTVKYIGTETSIKELIVFGTSKEFGFGLVRLLGDDMKPEKMIILMDAVKSRDFNTTDFGNLEGLLKSI